MSITPNTTALGDPTMLPVADGERLRTHVAGLFRGHRAGFSRVAILQVVAAVAGLTGPIVLGRMVDGFQNDTATATGVNVMIGILVVAVVIQAVTIRFAQRSALVLGETVFAQMREDFIETVTALPLSTIERAGTGDLVSRTTNDVDRVQHTIRFGIPRVIVSVATILITIVVAFVVSWQTAIAILLGVPLIVTAVRWYLKRATPAYLEESRRWAVMNGTFAETVEGARTVEALALAKRRRDRGESDIREIAKAEARTMRLRNVLFPSIDLAFGIPAVAVLVWGAWLVGQGYVTEGAVVVVAMYAMQLMGPVWELIFWVDEIQVATVSLARIYGVKDVPGDRVAGDDVPADDHVVAEGVEYAYREGTPVLHGIDLDLEVGERLAIVGPSGAGKSTFGRMLAGVHPPTAGRVTVGGVPLVELPLEDLRRQVALVTQEHHVFVGTLADNLYLAKPEATTDELRDALAAVDALGWALALPEGLETEVGSGGHELTPAQAQQLALARLVLLDPHTLVLDEATSLIDPRAARELETSLGAVLAGRTVVAIAHRLYTAHDADRVAVIDAGRIAEIGSHHELVEADGEYARLWHSWRTE
ncbi:ABC-type multidrug transport system fused ATPase/permease subunit [Salana multivorans]|uniref:ABC-type multidrug transport system fused ATPase/permease subunit n=1 Tax=Salana multivorans TaxID=120377 RepID=A0A3N2DCD7_9MICO|nr:ABC transporter ATP-binding protein [Salana multivorans]OJX97817.1 MAG: multidrug ABC transporter ATP-binding protein [Micrococcales bacterium 73-15]ROR97417.1 ABC-type multidrug transport system fused ATPase/permease subunit [Salana multivorans]